MHFLRYSTYSGIAWWLVFGAARAYSVYLTYYLFKVYLFTNTMYMQSWAIKATMLSATALVIVGSALALRKQFKGGLLTGDKNYYTRFAETPIHKKD